MSQETHGTRAGAKPRSRPHGLRDEFFGPPRPSARAQIFAALFALLTVTSIALLDSPGQPLMYSGITAMAFADLLDPNLHRFFVALRLVGPAIALFGFVLVLL